MEKLTVLYGHPTNVQDFEKYYADIHLPLAAKMPGVAKMELTVFSPAPDGSKPPFYRMAEVYFASASQMLETLSTPAGRAAADDIAKFATGGATLAFGSITTP